MLILGFAMQVHYIVQPTCSPSLIQYPNSWPHTQWLTDMTHFFLNCLPKVTQSSKKEDRQGINGLLNLKSYSLFQLFNQLFKWDLPPFFTLQGPQAPSLLAMGKGNNNLSLTSLILHYIVMYKCVHKKTCFSVISYNLYIVSRWRWVRWVCLQWGLALGHGATNFSGGTRNQWTMSFNRLSIWLWTMASTFLTLRTPMAPAGWMERVKNYLESSSESIKVWISFQVFYFIFLV